MSNEEVLVDFLDLHPSSNEQWDDEPSESERLYEEIESKCRQDFILEKEHWGENEKIAEFDKIQDHEIAGGDESAGWALVDVRNRTVSTHYGLAAVGELWNLYKKGDAIVAIEGENAWRGSRVRRFLKRIGYYS